MMLRCVISADLRASGGVRQEVIPVMLVGRGAAGKTTIVQRAIKKLQTTPNGMFGWLFLSSFILFFLLIPVDWVVQLLQNWSCFPHQMLLDGAAM